MVIHIFGEENDRRRILESYGASPAEIRELMEYNRNLFLHPENGEPIKLPLPDESFMNTWRRYQQEAAASEAFGVLRKNLLQLQFPIREGISQSEEYCAAVNRGVLSGQIMEADGVQLDHPEDLQLIIHQTAAGKVPLLYTGNRPDFIRLVQALAMRNEPVAIPDSMGAQIVAGYNNWDRIEEYRRNWRQANPGGDWHDEFKRIIPQKELYQDTFIILSNNEYSGVPAQDMGLAENTWRQMSLVVRREHECTHYLTRRLFGIMRNNMLDELIADYAGLVGAFGYYRAAQFLRFLGLADYPQSKRVGRIENYRGNPPLSDGAFEILKQQVIKAAYNLELFARTETYHTFEYKGSLPVIIALSRLTMEELAADHCHILLQQALNELHS